MSDLPTMIGSMNKLEEFLLKLKLSINQLKILRDILLEVGLIFFASWVIGPLVDQTFRIWLMVSGLIIPGFLWYTCIKLTSYLDIYE